MKKKLAVTKDLNDLETRLSKSFARFESKLTVRWGMMLVAWMTILTMMQKYS